MTTPRATSGNLARHVHDVHVRERPQSGQMSTRLPLIPRSLPGSAHRHFIYFRLRTDVPGLDRSRPGPPSRRRRAIARAGRSVTRTSTFGLASHPVRAWSPFTVQTIVLIPRRRHSASTPVRASRWCTTATSARLATTRSSRESPRARSRRIGECRRLGHITADGEPNGDGREPALEHRHHRTLTGRDDDTGRAERLNRVPHDHVRAAGFLQVNMAHRPARQQLHQLRHPRHLVAGEIAEPGVAHRGHGAAPARAVPGERPPASRPRSAGHRTPRTRRPPRSALRYASYVPLGAVSPPPRCAEIAGAGRAASLMQASSAGHGPAGAGQPAGSRPGRDLPIDTQGRLPLARRGPPRDNFGMTRPAAASRP